MRGWEWIVPVIVVVLWLINAVVKSRENDEPVRPKRAGGGRDGRNPAGDIDRFLQEIDQLRRKTAEERGAPPPPPVVRPAPVPRARPAPAVAAPRSRSAARQSSITDLVPLVQPIHAAAQGVRQGDPAADTARTLVPSMAGRMAAAYTTDLPRVTEALRMLRTPQSAATAFVIGEILGRPKCQQIRGSARVPRHSSGGGP